MKVYRHQQPMSEFEEQIQPPPAEQTQFNTTQLQDLFLQQAFQLIQTLPNDFPEEPDLFVLYNFIQYSGNFWIKVIPPL
jgi:hypothetical protein